jgi:hypothetical protein
MLIFFFFLYSVVVTVFSICARSGTNTFTTRVKLRLMSSCCTDWSVPRSVARRPSACDPLCCVRWKGVVAQTQVLWAGEKLNTENKTASV